MKRSANGESTNHWKTRAIKHSNQRDLSVKIAKIGTRLFNTIGIWNGSVKGVTTVQNEPFQLITTSDIIDDIKSVPEFDTKIYIEPNENNEDEVALWLVLTSNFSSTYRHVDGAAKRLIDKFFVLPKKDLFNEYEDENGDDEKVIVRQSFASIVQQVYEHLEAAHIVDDCLHRYVDAHIQHDDLLVQLKPFQIKTIKWMLSRETVVQQQTNGFVEIMKRSAGPLDGSIRFFYNPKTVKLTIDPNVCESFAVPSGGILAEEMGMGKTIEILDLILINPRPLQPAVPPKKTISQPAAKIANKIDMKCVCTQTKTSDTVRCTKCLKLQHRKCVDQIDSDITSDLEYICPACWQNEEAIPAKTTFIVSPQSIKTQWKSESDSRVKSGKISILLYAGSKSCQWISPKKLASYDVILTDYETLRSEFHFSDRNRSNVVLRNSSNVIKRKSPLLNVNFWRLCLDESQMVIDMKSKHSQIISDLSAVHRWAVTGTPIQTSINDLFGLFSFINYEPYNQSRRWAEIMDVLDCTSNVEPLVSILQPIMWRTCKSKNIMNEMDVPKQVQQVHYVELSDLNRYYYNQERDQCRQTFDRLISSLPLDTPLTSLSPSVVERLMEPVRTLRRNCSIHHVLDKDGNTVVMRPEQMLRYLIDTNALDAKWELNAIASKMRSLVALSLGDHKMKAEAAHNALNVCRKVLDWAKSYEKEPTMIESLLQMRSVHNILWVKKVTNSTHYNDELKALERLFHQTQADVIDNFKADRRKESKKFAEFELCFERNVWQWTNTALSHKKSETDLFYQIKRRTNVAYENVETAIATKSNISNTILKWCSNLLQQRKMFLRSFQQLKCGKQSGPSEHFSFLLNEAKKCHLKTSSTSSSDDDDGLDDEPIPAKRMRKDCTICSMNQQLNAYGTFISDVAHKKTRNAGMGRETTNPSFQEHILKVILQSNEYLGIINTKVGIDVLTALENFRFEYQKYKTLLSLIGKNVAHFHTVQMRKPPKPTTTDAAIKQWIDEIGYGKVAYDRKVRVIRYLNCMKDNAEIDECGICMSTFVEQVVFECGHLCCDGCFKKLTQDRSQFECPFCRQMQLIDKAHHFTIDKSEKYTDSSIKIEHIVRKVHELKRSDPKVKILIFSQWSDILNALKNELLANELSSRNVISSAKSLQKMVDEFKDPSSNVTCLLMPYRFGSKGLNLIEATHVFLVEPITNRGDELQTLGRVHRIGQTSETCVHRFITKNTIEETIYKIMSTDAAGLMSSEKCTIKTLVDLFADTA